MAYISQTSGAGWLPEHEPLADFSFEQKQAALAKAIAKYGRAKLRSKLSNLGNWAEYKYSDTKGIPDRNKRLKHGSAASNIFQTIDDMKAIRSSGGAKKKTAKQIAAAKRNLAKGRARRK